MLTLPPTIKTRLGLLPADSTYDDIITSAIQAVSARFNHETSRTLERTVAFTQEFDPSDTEIILACYPVESITRFETKASETEGWTEVTPPPYLLRRACILSLSSPLSTLNSQLSTARVTYTGGYVLPGIAPAQGQTALPLDLQNAATEQVAFWFQSRERLGLRTSWPADGEYKQTAIFDLLPSVRAVLDHHRRYSL